MTQSETAILTQLVSDIGRWKDEMHAEIADAIANHESTCLQRHLEPLGTKLDALIEAETTRTAAEKERARLAKFTAAAIAALAAMVGIAGGIIAIANGLLG